MNLPVFSFSYRFFRKSGFICRHTIAQKDFERWCTDYRISVEKGCFYGLSDDLSFFAVPLSRKRKAVCNYLNHKLSLVADK